MSDQWQDLRNFSPVRTHREKSDEWSDSTGDIEYERARLGRRLERSALSVPSRSGSEAPVYVGLRGRTPPRLREGSCRPEPPGYTVQAPGRAGSPRYSPEPEYLMPEYLRPTRRSPSAQAQNRTSPTRGPQLMPYGSSAYGDEYRSTAQIKPRESWERSTRGLDAQPAQESYGNPHGIPYESMAHQRTATRNGQSGNPDQSTQPSRGCSTYGGYANPSQGRDPDQDRLYGGPADPSQNTQRRQRFNPYGG